MSLLRASVIDPNRRWPMLRDGDHPITTGVTGSTGPSSTRSRPPLCSALRWPLLTSAWKRGWRVPLLCSRAAETLLPAPAAAQAARKVPGLSGLPARPGVYVRDINRRLFRAGPQRRQAGGLRETAAGVCARLRPGDHRERRSAAAGVRGCPRRGTGVLGRVRPA